MTTPANHKPNDIDAQHDTHTLRIDADTTSAVSQTESQSFAARVEGQAVSLLPVDETVMQRVQSRETLRSEGHTFDRHDETITRRIEGDEQVIIPLVAETYSVDKEEVVSGVVRIHKTVTEHEERIETPTYHESVQVERVPRNEWVEAAPPIRYEGQTMVIPVVEEVLVVEKRLRLREELRVTKQRIEETTAHPVILRREEITIERESRDPSAPRES